MKPALTLSQLERGEPLVHFGCTWSEIKTCVWRGAALALPLTGAGMALTSIPVIGILPGLGLWVGLAYGFTRLIHAQRAGKPLFYEKHRKKVRGFRSPFIQAGVIYQSQRWAGADLQPPRAAWKRE